MRNPVPILVTVRAYRRLAEDYMSQHHGGAPPCPEAVSRARALIDSRARDTAAAPIIIYRGPQHSRAPRSRHVRRTRTAYASSDDLPPRSRLVSLYRASDDLPPRSRLVCVAAVLSGGAS